MKKMIVSVSVIALVASASSAFAQDIEAAHMMASRYDGAGRLVGTIEPVSESAGAAPARSAARWSYDSRGRPSLVEEGRLQSWQSDAVEPAAWTSFVVDRKTQTYYDVRDRVTREVVSSSQGALLSVKQYSYDPAGRLKCQVERMNPAVFSSAPANACAPGEAGSDGPDRIERHLYDLAGRLVQVRRAVGTPLEQASTTYGYTPNGKQKYLIDARGARATFLYDGHDRVTQWQLPSAVSPVGFNPDTPASALETASPSNSDDSEGYSYDENGNRTAVRKRDGRSINYNYDAKNQLIAKIISSSCGVMQAPRCVDIPASLRRNVYYSYDLRGMQTGARFDSRDGVDAVVSTFDGVGRVTSSITSMNGFSRKLTYENDEDGNRIKVTHPDGSYVSYNRDSRGRIYYTAINGAPLFYPQYDERGRLSKLYRLRHSDGNWGMPSSSIYDVSSRVSSLTNSFTSSNYDVTYGFTYNSSDQIATTQQNNAAYSFGGYYNAHRNYAANGINQYTSAGSTSFAHDANGNLAVNSDAQGTEAYTYDAENRLVQSSSGVNLVYDPLGRLFQTSVGAAQVTQFLYDGDDLSAEYGASGALLRRYVHGDGDAALVWFEGADLTQPRYIYTDQRGSVTAITDKDGNVINTVSYDEFGIPHSPNSGYFSRFLYTSQAWIGELGMYHYKARVYSPTLGRFLQTDPIGYSDDINLYAYVGNDPVNNVDPTGLDCASLQAGVADAYCDPFDPEMDAPDVVITGRQDLLVRVQRAIDPVEIAFRIISAASGQHVSNVKRDVVFAIQNPLQVLGEMGPAFPLASGSASFLKEGAKAYRGLAVNVVKGSGSQAALNAAWGPKAVNALSAIKSGVTRPPGVGNDVLQAYRTSLNYQIAAGRDLEVAPLRLRLIEKWLKE